jgi:hypothetical protein
MPRLTHGARVVVIASGLAVGCCAGYCGPGPSPSHPEVAPPASASSDQDPMAGMNMDMSSPGWQFMRDGVVFGVFNHQGGPRAGRSSARRTGGWAWALAPWARSQFTFTGMLSLDPATVGRQGYREIFQVGEIYQGHPLIDHQHPHDFFMQLAAVVASRGQRAYGFHTRGRPCGRGGARARGVHSTAASSAENPFAPLSHHTFDSTHVRFWCCTAAVDHGRWVVEGSVFNGREPDEHRWDFDFGRLDSVSTRGVVSSPARPGRFRSRPDACKTRRRSNLAWSYARQDSVSWFRPSGGDFCGRDRRLRRERDVTRRPRRRRLEKRRGS